jgi:hypothetical protein
MIFTFYHFFNNKKINWTLQYNIRFREKMTNQTANIKACEKDMYIIFKCQFMFILTHFKIIYNNWLVRAIPILDVKFDLIFIIYKI